MGEPLKPLRFIGVDALLIDIGRGLGLASRELVTRSASEVGTLAVKTADVTVSFEMTSAASSRKDGLSLEGDLLFGAKTLSFASETFEEKQTNRCTITLHIVSVAPGPPDKDAKVVHAPAGAPAPPDKGANVPDAPASAAAPAAREQLLALIEALRSRLPTLDLPAELKASISEELAANEQLVKANELDKARAALVHFATKYLSGRP